MNTTTIVQKLWNPACLASLGADKHCNVLRDDLSAFGYAQADLSAFGYAQADGMLYGDYVEQLTYLLFLKMADERSRPPYSQKSPVPEGRDWASLLKKDGDELFDHYRHLQ